MKKSVVQLLREARDLLKSDGWTRYKLEDVKGRHCALGAIMAVSRYELSSWGQYEAIRKLAQAIKGHEVQESYEAEVAVYTFNDNKASDVDDVLRQFNTAIRLAKQDAV